MGYSGLIIVLEKSNLLTFFNNFPFNQLIENGHLYLAQPPLFKVTKGSKSVYIKNEKDLEKYILKPKENPPYLKIFYIYYVYCLNLYIYLF